MAALFRLRAAAPIRISIMLQGLRKRGPTHNLELQGCGNKNLHSYEAVKTVETSAQGIKLMILAQFTWQDLLRVMKSLWPSSKLHITAVVERELDGINKPVKNNVVSEEL